MSWDEGLQGQALQIAATPVVSSVTGLPSASAFKMGARTRQTIGGTTQTVASQFIHELRSQSPATITGQQFGLLTSGQP